MSAAPFYTGHGFESHSSFFQALISIAQVACITAMIIHVFLSFSSVQIYGLSYIHLYLHQLRYITNLQRDKLAVGLITQFVEHCTSIAEYHMGSNPVQARFCFTLWFRNFQSFVYNCVDQSCLHRVSYIRSFIHSLAVASQIPCNRYHKVRQENVPASSTIVFGTKPMDPSEFLTHHHWRLSRRI